MKTERSEGTAVRYYTPLRGGSKLFLFIIIAVGNYMAKEHDEVELLQH